MIEKMNKWLSAHKQLCVITGIFGLLVSPFLWPVFLAVIIQSLSLVIPVAAGLFFYEKFIMKNDAGTWDITNMGALMIAKDLKKGFDFREITLDEMR